MVCIKRKRRSEIHSLRRVVERFAYANSKRIELNTILSETLNHSSSRLGILHVGIKPFDGLSVDVEDAFL